MLKPIFYTRDGTINPFQAPWLEVNQASWSEVGGCDAAALNGWNLGRVDLAGALVLLGCGVELVDESEIPCWWGYVEKIQLFDKKTGAVCSLGDMSNRVKVSYISLDFQGLSFRDQRIHTGWADNADSQAVYGIKERIIRLQESTLAQAAAHQAGVLNECAWPVARPALRSRLEGGDLSITLKGWWHTTAWRYYEQTAGVIEDAVDGIGIQDLGGNSSAARAAQSFTVGAVGWRCEAAWLRLCKIGAPGDAVRVYLCADAGGQPGSSLAYAELAAENISTGYAWTGFIFTSPPDLDAGATYWIQVQRVGTLNDSNFYRLKIDEDLKFSGGALKILDGASWVSRSPDGDLVFRLSGGLETTRQVELMAAAGCGGQFLSGVSIERDSGVQANPFRSGDATAQAEIIAHLAAGDAAGGRLSCEVTRERVLRVYAAPGPETAVLRINGDGYLAGERGTPLAAWAPAAGQWAILENPWLGGGSPDQEITDRFYMKRVEYDAKTGFLRPV